MNKIFVKRWNDRYCVYAWHRAFTVYWNAFFGSFDACCNEAYKMRKTNLK